MRYKYLVAGLLLFVISLTGCASNTGGFAVHSQMAVEIELNGYDGLSETGIYKGAMNANSKHQIKTPYRGLALLSFSGGQRYPVILGDEPFTLNISDPSQTPTFTGSTENNLLYKSMSGYDSIPEQYDFVKLMIQAKELLESTHSIKTIEELTAKKQEYHEFVGKHYASLKHSDMIRRLLAQYFIFHEYINYHVEGEPATQIRVKYQQEVVSGVGSWIEILSPQIPKQEVLNYCVSLYYDRSMVTLASLIIDNFRDVAYCSGTEKKASVFPGDLRITKAKGAKVRKLDDLKGDKLIAYVSDDCPVSMVETVIKARQMAAKKENIPVVVAPLQKLSGSHFAMARMVSNGNMYFIDDEAWRKANLNANVKLPLFVRIEATL
jgi:hypothetical protein